MIYFIVGAPCIALWLCIAIFGIIADAQDRAAWSQVFSDREVRR